MPRHERSHAAVPFFIVATAAALWTPAITRLSPGREPGVGSRPPATQAGGDTSIAKMSAPYRQNIERLLDYCGKRGMRLVPSDAHPGGYIIREPSVAGIEMDVYLCAFRPKTSAAEMQDALSRFAPPFPYMNEDAGLAMSHIERRFLDPGVANDAAKNEDVSKVEHRIGELLRAYRPPAPATNAAAEKGKGEN